MRLIPIPVAEWTEDMRAFDRSIRITGETNLPDPKDVLLYIDQDTEMNFQYHTTFFHIDQFILWPGAVEIDGIIHLPTKLP